MITKQNNLIEAPILLNKSFQSIVRVADRTAFLSNIDCVLRVLLMQLYLALTPSTYAISS